MTNILRTPKSVEETSQCGGLCHEYLEGTSVVLLRSLRIVTPLFITAMSTKNSGLIRGGAGNAVLHAIPLPQIRDEYILVKTVAIALNPTDWTTLDAKGDDGTIVGCDYAGVVEEVGTAVKRSFMKGDRIAGFCHGGVQVLLPIAARVYLF